MTETTRLRAPVPTGVSEAAQQFLSVPPAPRPANPALNDVEGWLRRVEQTDAFILSRFAGQAPPVETEERQIADVRTYVSRARDAADSDDTPVYLSLHGGAFIYGGGEICRFTTGLDAMTTGMITWGPDYRMAPRHPYPAALDDCVAIYRALLEVRDPADIFIGGGSAGGNLAAALLVRAKDERLPMPAALVLCSPELDLTESGDTFHTLNGIDNVLTTSLREVNLLYAAGNDLAHPYLSPLFADVTGFPPTFLQSGTRDLFLSNTVRMHRKLRAAGVDAQLHVFEAMPHGGFNGAPEDHELSREIRQFLDRRRRTRRTH